MTQSPGIDPACFDLADHFLEDEPPSANDAARRQRLALRIQEAVEDWFSEEERTDP